MNKYEKWYNNIVQNAQDRVTDSYVEQHHIIPRSLGGSDESTNLVDLTAKEHFVCHWLLVKMHTGDARGKMINALYMMRGQSIHQKRYESKITGRIYETLREEYASYISKMNKGRVQPPEEKARQLAAQTGRKRAPFSNEWKAKLSEAGSGKNNSMYGKTHSEETRKLLSEKAKLRTYSAETNEKRRQSQLGRIQPKKLCPHCNNLISVNTYPRWHGDRCKSLA
jgi:ribosomal protein L33